MIGAKPPAVSPYSVENPAAVSDLLPVVSTSQPCWFESAIRIRPRSRACTFSAASPSMSGRTSCTELRSGSIGSSRNDTPSRSATSWASERVSAAL